MDLSLASKLPDVGTTIFSVMSALAAEHDALNLSQGFPDFEPPDLLKLRVTERIAAGHNQYPPMHGIAPLREAIATSLAACHGIAVDPESEITVTSGASEGLFSALLALVQPGDEVIVFDPAYDLYEPAIRLAGGRARRLPLRPPGHTIDLDRLAAAIGDRTRALIVNTPHNPTGSLLDAATLDAIAGLVADSRCLVLSDEVYEHITFDGRGHASVLANAALRERAAAVYSFGKTYHATGWKVGYVVASAAVTAEIRRVHQFNTFTTASPLQWALADFLAAEPDFAATIAPFYEAKRDRFLAALAASRFTLRPSAGTYFQLADYSAISDAPDTEFVRTLTAEHGVAAIPLSVFYERPPRQRLVRFCFAKADSTLDEAAERLCAI
ncbi:MAG: methionine aminotransferase [Pseudomonadota bacterium]